MPTGVEDLQGVACPDTTDCYAVGSGPDASGPGWVVARTDGGRQWQLLDTVHGIGLTTIACPTSQSCIAGGGSLAGSGLVAEALVTSDGGRSWTTVPMPTQVGEPIDIACASALRCIGVGGGSAMALTADGGGTWAAESLPSGLRSADSVTCPTATSCIVGDAGPGPGSSAPSMGALSHDGGTTWSAAAVVGGSSALGDVSCGGTTHCVGLIASDATDSAGTGTPIVTTDGATSWQHVATTVGGSVSCLPGVCVSVGASSQENGGFRPVAEESTDGGLHWRSMPMEVPSAGVLGAVSCPALLDCIAVGGDFPADTTALILRTRS